MGDSQHQRFRWRRRLIALIHGRGNEALVIQSITSISLFSQYLHLFEQMQEHEDSRKKTEQIYICVCACACP